MLNLICFAACIEGLFFFAAFAYVYFLRSRGLLHGLAGGTNWVFRDESGHMAFAFDVVRTVRREEPALFDDALAATVGTMLDEAIECETAFAEDLLGGGVAGLSVGDVRQYLEFIADQRLATLGLPKRYRAKNPLAFMDLQDVPGARELLRAPRVGVPDRRRGRREPRDGVLMVWRADSWVPATALGLALGLTACGGRVAGARPHDGGVDAGPIDAGWDAAGLAPIVDAGGDAAIEASIADAGACSANGPIAIAGDYTAGDGTEHWLRTSATAATYTVVPADAQVPSIVPELFRIERVCPRWLVLESTDGTFARLDWTTAGGALGICVRAATGADAAMGLAPPDPSDAAAGCGGTPWTGLTKAAP